MIGCKHKCYVQEIRDIDFLIQKKNVIVPKELDYCPLGTNEIISFDNYIFLTTNDPTGQLKIIDIDNDTLVVSICSKGRANNEFIEPMFVGEQAYYKDGEIILPLIDNRVILKEINITQSIKENKAVIKEHTSCISPLDGFFALINDDINKTFVFERPILSNGECGLPEYYIKEEGKEKKTIPVYDDKIDGDNRVSVYAQYLGNVHKHPRKNLMIQPLQNMDYILFFDLDNNHYYAVHQEGSRTFDDKVITNNNYKPSSLCFGNVAVSNDAFYVLYYANCINTDTNNKSEILMFDWDGNYIDGYVSDIEIHRITYNEKRNILFGLNISEEKIFQIDL